MFEIIIYFIKLIPRRKVLILRMNYVKIYFSYSFMYIEYFLIEILRIRRYKFYVKG